MTVNIKEQELLYKVFDYYSKKSYNSYDFEKVKKIQISDSFDKRMQRLIKQRRKPYFRLINTAAKRVACIIAALIIAATCTVLSVDALREGVKNFFLRTYEKFSTLSFSTDDDAGPAKIEEYHIPTYIPEGYKIIKSEKCRTIYYVSYKNDNGTEIYYSQQCAYGNEMLIDTEDAVTEEINGGLFTFKEEKNRSAFYRNDGKYIYEVIVYGDITREEVLKIADSIKAEA